MEEHQVFRQKQHKITFMPSTPKKLKHRFTVGESKEQVFSAKFDPNDHYVACGYGDGITRIFNMETGKLAF